MQRLQRSIPSCGQTRVWWDECLNEFGWYVEKSDIKLWRLITFACWTCSWAAQPWGVGDNVSPTFWDQRGTGEYRGAVQWKWSLLLQQTVFIQYCTSDWISTPLTLVDHCQVNDIWKDGLSRVSTVHPHWTAALFKSTCQHAHAAVNWLSISKRIINAITNTQHYFKTYHARCQWPNIGRALYKVWHTAAKLSHETNLAITKLSLSLIHNTIGLGLPMFIIVTTRQQISMYSIGPF